MNFIPLLIIFGVIFLGYYIITYNGYIMRQEKVKESLSGIDVALSKRYNLISNMVETVKGYAKHEVNLFEKVASLRNNANQNLDHYNDELTEVKAQLFALVESYPELKADQHFLMLQKSLVDTEEHLQAARRLHNSNVNNFNTFIQVAPNNLLAPMNQAKPVPFFEATTIEQAVVDIKF